MSLWLIIFAASWASRVPGAECGWLCTLETQLDLIDMKYDWLQLSACLRQCLRPGQWEPAQAASALAERPATSEPEQPVTNESVSKPS